MLVVLTIMIIAVLIGLAYADYCLVDNTAHFGMTFERVAEVEKAREEQKAALEAADSDGVAADESEVVVPPAVDVPPIAAVRADRPARTSPRRRPGSGRRNSGPFPVVPATDTGVAAIGN